MEKVEIGLSWGKCSFPLVFIILFDCWNVRGLNDPMKQGEVKKFIQEQQLTFCRLIETKDKECNQEGVLNAIGRSWNVLCNYGLVNHKITIH